MLFLLPELLMLSTTSARSLTTIIDVNSLNSLNTIDVTHPRYRANVSLPDKTHLWAHPMEEDGWVHAHNALRGEIDVMRDILQALGRRSLKAWEVSSLQSWWTGHEIHVHDHHANEDLKFSPYMATRINLPAKLTTDHMPLVEMLDALGARINRLREGDSAVELRREWTRYERLMKPHLREEEQIALPLLRAYFTPAEVGKLVESILGESPQVSLGSFLYFMGGTREACAKFMENEGIPFFVWYIAFKGHIQVYQDQMVRHADALRSGTPPPPVSQSSTLTMLVLTLVVLGTSAVARRRLAKRGDTTAAAPTLSPTKKAGLKVACPPSPQPGRASFKEVLAATVRPFP